MNSILVIKVYLAFSPPRAKWRRKKISSLPDKYMIGADLLHFSGFQESGRLFRAITQFTALTLQHQNDNILLS